MEVPQGVVNETLAVVFVVPLGAKTVTDPLSTVESVAFVEPNCTLYAFCKFVPVIVTCVPPVLAPDVGEIDVITGAVQEVVFMAGSTTNKFE